MNAFSILQTDLSPAELLGAVVIGLLALALIISLFRRKRPAPGAPATSSPHPSPSPGPSVDLAQAIARAEREIVTIARKREPSASAFHFGAVDIDPKHLAYWITTATDAERDRLAADVELHAAFRRAVAEAGYPAEAVAEVGLAFQSEETVQRDYGGNWYYAVK